MSETNAENLISELMSKGYDINAINQISKAVDNNFILMKNIEMHVLPSTIRKLNETYSKFYKKSDENVYKIQELLVKAANKNLDLTYITDKFHRQCILSFLIEELIKGKEIDFYTTNEDAADFELNKIQQLKNLQDDGMVSILTKEQIEIIKKSTFEFADDMYFFKAKNEKILNTFLTFLNEYKIEKSYRLAKIQEKSPEWIDFLKNKGATEIKEFTELLEINLNNEKIKKIKDYLNKFSLSELKKILEFPINENSIDVIKLKYQPSTIINILQNIKEHEIDVLKLFDDFEFRFNAYELKELSKLYREIDKEKFKSVCTQEAKNNIDASIYDFLELLKGIKSNINIERYLTDEDQVPYDSEVKKLIRNILEYNNRNIDNPIDLSLVFDESQEKGEDLYDEGNVSDLIELLEEDINIIPFLNANCDTIQAILYNKENYKLTPKQINTILEYEKFEPSNDEEYEFIINIVSQGYEILNKDDIYKKSISIYKEINKLAEYDEFSKKVIDEQLNDENHMRLLECLKQYQTSSGILQEICKLNIENNYFYLINQNISKNISEDKLNIILSDLKDGINPFLYATEKFSVEKMKNLSNIARAINKIEDTYYKKDMIGKFKKICDKNFSSEQLKLIEDFINNRRFNIISRLEPSYSTEQMKLYDKWIDISYIYNFDLYAKAKEIDDIIATKVRRTFEKLDKTLPIEEQEQIFINCQKQSLESAAASAEIDTSIFIYKLIDKLEDKNNEKNIVNEKKAR